MPTTKSGFIEFTTGGAVVFVAVPAGKIDGIAAAFTSTRLDKILVDLSKSSYAKNGGVRLTLSGATPQSIDLTNTTATGAYSGDTSFAAVGTLILVNDGAQPVTVTPGGTNGARLPFATITLYPGDQFPFVFATPEVVDSTHKVLVATPTVGGSLVVLVGGA